MGYDVFMGCRRGTQFSRSAEGLDLTTAEGRQLYFDYNTKTVGENDIAAFVQRANELYNRNRATPCEFMQIVAHGHGAAEVLAGLSANPFITDITGTMIPLQRIVAKVTNLAPCAVSTYHMTEDKKKEDPKMMQQDVYSMMDSSGGGWRLLHAL